MTEGGEHITGGEPSDVERVYVPENWTILYHGTNLDRAEWQGNARLFLDNDELQVTGQPGLSCITEEERRRDRERADLGLGNYDTTKNYSTIAGGGHGKPMEIRIVFPGFHSRRTGFRAIEESYRERYGDDRMRAIMDLVNNVHWGISQRHPVIPNGTTLVKLQDLDGNNRVITYVPKLLEGIFRNELIREVGKS